MASSTIKELKKQEIDLLKKGVCIVDFWASWCGPCRAFAPVFEELAQEMEKDHVTFFKVNVDDEQELASMHGIRSIPTLKIFKDGELVETLVGMQHKDDLRAKLQEYSS